MDPTLPNAPPSFSLDLSAPAWLRRLMRRQRVPASDVDDVVQEVCIRVWQKSNLVEAADEPSAYVTEIAKQVARAYHLRSSRREQWLVAQELHEAQGAGPTPEHHAVTRQCCAVVGGFIDQIEAKARPIFLERAVDGDSVAEIAARHGLTERRVKTLLHVAWGDFEAAKRRWEAEDRRRGGGRLWGLAFPLWSIDLRRWLRSLSRAALQIAAAAASVLLTVVACPSDLVSPEPRWSSGSIVQPLGPHIARHLSPGSEGDRPRANHPAPDVAHDRATGPARQAASGPLGAEQQAPLLIEEKLIGGARAALLLGTPEGRVRADLLLKEHRERFPRGRLARDREELLSKPR